MVVKGTPSIISMSILLSKGSLKISDLLVSRILKTTKECKGVLHREQSSKGLHPPNWYDHNLFSTVEAQRLEGDLPLSH
jgi:hypothetical protein